MKRLVLLTLALALALLVIVTSARASTGSVPGHRCKASEPQVLRLTAFGTSCSVARALERLQMHHDPEEGFTVGGRHFSWYVYSRAHRHTYEVFVAVPGATYVQLVWGGEAS